MPGTVVPLDHYLRCIDDSLSSPTMAEYTTRTPARKYTEEEKAVLDSLWESGELRGVGKRYTPTIERVSQQLGRTPKEIEVSKRYYCGSGCYFVTLQSIW